jgi:hypothetical protein
MMPFFQALSLLLFSLAVHCISFPFESIQLSDANIGNFSAIEFGDASSAPSTYIGSQCKAAPGDAAWPTLDEWAQFNKSLGGRLLKPRPAGAVCFPGPDYDNNTCAFLMGPVRETRFWLDDPVAALSAWHQGDTCTPNLKAAGTCLQGGNPIYVVNATSVKDIQLAVNFARNRNIRLNIK